MKREKSMLIDHLLRWCKNPKHVCEVGCYNPDDLVFRELCQDPNTMVSLVEPNPSCLKRLHAEFAGDNVMIYPYAVADYNGRGMLKVPIPRERNPDAPASAFMGTESPAEARRNAGQIVEELENVPVEVCTFDRIDDGTIDGIMIDTEGYEWYVLEAMISRPWVIGIEMQGPCGYRNPFYTEIVAWMATNGYEHVHTDHVRRAEKDIPTDYIYVRKA